MDMNDLKFHIILPYYKRRLLVSNALNSILKSNYDNWFLTLIDDSGNRGFEEEFNKYGFDKNTTEYLSIGMSDDEKQKIGGSIFGSFINDAIHRIQSDIIIILCDDDALTHDYMKKLNEYYKYNPNIPWSYCHVIFYNPNEIAYCEAKETDSGGVINFLNDNTEPIHPKTKLDSSQVTFRRSLFLDHGVAFPSPKTIALDAVVFSAVHDRVGDCPFNKIKGQYKASFPDQLGRRVATKRGEYIKL